MYRKRNDSCEKENSNKARADFPLVTIQLPLYNEKYVVERLLDSVVNIDWPKKSMEIQILDDSNDETSDIIRKKLTESKFSNFDILHIKRQRRTGFKAGALQVGLKASKGAYIAIFDADFMPHPSFLHDTVKEFENPSIGMVQTRWEHLNREYSLLTKLQAFGLNGHFRVEQTGRYRSGSFINFNGTAGIWRKACIEEAGGWQSDTLTEDLDLSYRAQMNGWKFKYLEHVPSPSELPVIMSAVKSQQYRWTKGGAETAKKNLGKILRTKLDVTNKIHAFFHLTNSANFPLLLIASIISIPLLLVKSNNPQFKIYFDAGSIFLIGFLAISYFYWVANKNEHTNKEYFKYFPLFMMFSMGFTLHNSLAVIEGLLGIKSSFIRTPKFNIIGVKGSWKGNMYLNQKITLSTLFEGILSLYFFAGIAVGVTVGDYGLILFHFMLALGYASIFYYSIKH
ncbi:MAG: glycosyltransferase family 2 protein [Cytophagales bacterium]|nr:glycosyltransferase family 2 protein [Cytophagales bacterium]